MMIAGGLRRCFPGNGLSRQFVSLVEVEIVSSAFCMTINGSWFSRTGLYFGNSEHGGAGTLPMAFWNIYGWFLGRRSKGPISCKRAKGRKSLTGSIGHIR